MRLVDLEPRWSGAYESTPDAVVSFLCPVCRKHRIDIPITPTRNGAALYPGGVHWRRTGEDFESMTLSPSIAHDAGNGCKWHGFIRNGEIVNA